MDKMTSSSIETDYMMNKKVLAEKIIIDLTTGESMSTILLKVQLLASLLGNDEFNTWLKNEQYGYTDATTVPEYRKLRCGIIKADIVIPYGGMWKDYDIPLDAIEDTYVRDLMSITPFAEPIATLEGYANPSDGKSKMLQVGLPSGVMPYIDEVVDGSPHKTIRAKKLVSSQAVKGIIDHIKSTLLDFIIKLDRELDLNIDITLAGQETISKIMNTTINANIVHTGTGNIDATNSNIISGDNATITLSSEVKQNIQDLISQLSALNNRVGTDEVEFTEYLTEIQEELNKKISSPKILRRCLRLIKSFGGIVTEKAVELRIDQLISALPIG